MNEVSKYDDAELESFRPRPENVIYNGLLLCMDSIRRRTERSILMGDFPMYGRCSRLERLHET